MASAGSRRPRPPFPAPVRPSRAPSRPSQAGDRPRRAAPPHSRSCRPRARRHVPVARPRPPGADPQVDARLSQRRRHLLARERLLPRDQPVESLDDRHARPERRPGLREARLQRRPRRGRRGSQAPLFAVVASRSHGRASFSPGIGGITLAASSRDHDRLPGQQDIVAHADALLAVEPAAPSHDLDAALLQPRQLDRVVEVVDHLVTAREHRWTSRLPLGMPTTRCISAIISPGRSSALDGMHA